MNYTRKELHGEGTIRGRDYTEGDYMKKEQHWGGDDMRGKITREGITQKEGTERRGNDMREVITWVKDYTERVD